MCIVAVGAGAVMNGTCQGGLVDATEPDEKAVVAIVESDLPSTVPVAMQDFSNPMGVAEINQDSPNQMDEPPPAVPNLQRAPEKLGRTSIPVPAGAAINIVVSSDHNGQVERLESDATEVAYRVTFPNLTRDLRLNLPEDRVFDVDQVWVLSDTLNIKDFNHRVAAVINDTGGLVITVRAFSKPDDARLANRGTADFDHYFGLAARLGDLSFRALLK